MGNKADQGLRLFADIQTDLFEKSYEEQIAEKVGQPVTCLGIAFENDAERRKYFTEKLGEKLKDPEFRKVEGFPIGTDEDILTLSDPPYYTACPNPFLSEVIRLNSKKQGVHEKISTPLAIDVSGSKKDTSYTAHTYHTKVPPDVISGYILNFTDPDDIVVDFFSGSGMTGIGAQLANKPSDETVEALKIAGADFKTGNRNCVLFDLSPAASFISYGHQRIDSPNTYKIKTDKLINAASKGLSHLYTTRIKDRDVLIKYRIYSDVYICNECGGEFDYWSVSVDIPTMSMKDDQICPHCGAEIIKRNLQQAGTTRALETGDIETVAKESLSAISIDGVTGIFLPQLSDELLDTELKKLKIPLHCNRPMLGKGTNWGDQWRKGNHQFVTSAHHFYSTRNYFAFGFLWDKVKHDPALAFTFTGCVSRGMKRWAVLPNKLGVGNIAMGTLYIPSLHYEMNPLRLLKTKTSALKKYYSAASTYFKKDSVFVSTQSSTTISQLPDESVDYIFTDPPFGDNLAYSELNFLWESWLKVFTNQDSEAIISKAQGKDLFDYERLMKKTFSEAYRILKPGKWITIVFHNSKNSVWNAIQQSLFHAGFVVADIRTLDKTQGSYNQIVASMSVKQDLVISAYKPNHDLEQVFSQNASNEDCVWNFVRNHLSKIPVIVEKQGKSEIIAERQNFLLFDRMVAFYVQRGFLVPMSSSEFYLGLTQRFSERDGMFFLVEQAAEYDKKRMACDEIIQSSLFVSDEATAIQWLQKLLKEKPQAFKDLHPQFMREISGWSKNEVTLELSVLLEQNFLRYEGKGVVPEQIHAYLSSNWKELRNLDKDDSMLVAKAKDRWYVPDPNKAGDLEKLRERALLKEFEEYKQAKKKFKLFRLEAVRAGFKKAWQQRDYPTIVSVADKIPNNVLEEDPKLLMWYDQAVTRLGGE